MYEPVSFLRENAIAFATLPQDFSENVIATETSYQMLNVLSFWYQELGYAQPHLKKNFSGVKRENEAFQGVYFFRIHTKN